MKWPRLNPTVRITLGLVFMTLSLVLSAVFLGITPDPTNALLEARKSVVEGLAVQAAALGHGNDNDGHKEILGRVVGRNDDVISAGLRSRDGHLIAQAGPHEQLWVNIPLDQSTATFAQVPIFAGNERWATLEVHFAEMESLSGNWLPQWLLNLLAFLAVAGFIGYWLFMRRTLREVDPSAVVPARVKSAMDGLLEGVMLIDERARAVLVNRSLCDRLEMTEKDFIDKPPSALRWIDPTTGKPPAQLPWHVALKEAVAHTGSVLCLAAKTGEMRTFVCNASPITDGNGRSRGALVTLDDITDIEKKNTELKQALTTLESSRREIQKQNKALERLATRDPMTNCLNRRAFFEQFNSIFSDATENNRAVSCIMTDIDHFKRINDGFGHAMGDEVIKLFANILQSGVRENDLVCRYGGEEFCIILPDLDVKATTVIAERLRSQVAQESKEKVTCGARVTASFGVAMLDESMSDGNELVNRADEALYAAKESGRNRVIAWHGTAPLVAKPDKTQPDTEQDTSHNQTPTLPQVAKLQKQVRELELALDKRTQALRHGQAHDTTTGLPNRVLFKDRIAQALARARRNSRSIAVLSLEVTTLRRVDSALGPMYSEKLLRRLSERLVSATRYTDTVMVFEDTNEGPTLSRLGDNEFGLLIADMTSTKSVTWLVKRVLQNLGQSIEMDGHAIFFNASVGVSVFPNDGRTPEALMMNASAARQHAHQNLGRNSYQFYSEEMNQEARQQLELDAALRTALKEDQLTLHFQPKFTLRGGRLTGVEALVRWMHPTLGTIPPSQFIPVAEQSGLITELGYWVMKTSSQWLRHWQQQGAGDLTVAVNVSGIQFRDPHFVERVGQITAKAGISAASLEVELTESTIMENLDLAHASIEALTQRGIRVSVDDFGTGYSSLSYLKTFPLHCLKIDRSFLLDIATDATADTLVGTICLMARKLGLRVVAEGVEEVEQVRALQRHRCDEVQGFLFAPPVTGDEITALLNDGLRSNPAMGLLSRRWPFRIPVTRRTG